MAQERGGFASKAVDLGRPRLTFPLLHGHAGLEFSGFEVSRAGAVEAEPGPNPGKGGRKRPLGRQRLATIPDASAKSLEGFVAADTEKPLVVSTDGWRGYRGLDAKG